MAWQCEQQCSRNVLSSLVNQISYVENSLDCLNVCGWSRGVSCVLSEINDRGFHILILN